MPRPKKDRAEKKQFATVAGNVDVAEKLIFASDNYEGIYKIKGVAPDVKHSNLNKIYRTTKQYVTIEQWCDIIYGWLLLNPKMLSITDFYNYPKDNAPFMYTLDEVINFDSDKIFNLLQERISTMMMRREIDRESALAVLRERYGWSRDNETNVNLNTGGVVSFKFGDSLINNENQTTDENGKDN